MSSIFGGAILGLTEVQKQQIFTVNALPPKEGIPYHKEVWISRGQYSDVYSVEVPPEWYWAFTTERVEKEAWKIYERAFNDDIEQAITHIEEDRKKMNMGRYFDFAVLVNKHQNIMSLWERYEKRHWLLQLCCFPPIPPMLGF